MDVAEKRAIFFNTAAELLFLFLLSRIN